MVELKKYTKADKDETINRIVDFFGFHSILINEKTEITIENLKEAEESLLSWQSDDNELYVIFYNKISVGFIRIGYRGSIAAWIEDIYVDSAYRNKGIASEAIRSAEAIVQSKPNYTAVCLDVVTRNTKAIDLYYELGYRDISIITLRKEFGESKRDKELNMLGKSFKY